MKQNEINKEQGRKEKSTKTMLLLAMGSIVMIFAGLTSAYVVSKSRPDWLSDFTLPSAFTWSTMVIIVSSLCLILAKRALVVNNRKASSALLLLTFVLGLAFVALQFEGFNQVVASGYYFTGSNSTVTTSFIYVLILVHIAHLFGGLISLLIVIYNHSKNKYTSNKTLGFDSSAMFWHFLGILWIYLFLFFTLYK